jgi:hypothetical protein
VLAHEAFAHGVERAGADIAKDHAERGERKEEERAALDWARAVAMRVRRGGTGRAGCVGIQMNRGWCGADEVSCRAGATKVLPALPNAVRPEPRRRGEVGSPAAAAWGPRQ